MATISFADALTNALIAPPPYVAAFGAVGLHLDQQRIKNAAADYIRSTPALNGAVDTTPLDPANVRANAFRLAPGLMAGVVAALLPQPGFWLPVDLHKESTYDRYKREASQRLVLSQNLAALNAGANAALAMRTHQLNASRGQEAHVTAQLAATQATLVIRDGEILARNGEILALKATAAAKQADIVQLQADLKTLTDTQNALTQHLTDVTADRDALKAINVAIIDALEAALKNLSVQDVKGESSSSSSLDQNARAAAELAFPTKPQPPSSSKQEEPER